MAYAADLCGSKLKEKLSSTLNESAAAPMSSSSFAAKQMAKMGWESGTGLGKKRDGMVSHIKVRKREENMGLGVEKERTRKLGTEGMWWSTNVSNTLMRLQQKKDEKKPKKKKSSKKSKKDKGEKKKKKDKSPKTPKIYTDEELFQATGGARFGMRAQRRAEGKWQRTENSQTLKDWEQQVKGKVEWNGLGKAKLVLSEEKNNRRNSSIEKKRKRNNDEYFEEKKKEDIDEELTKTPSSNAHEEASSEDKQVGDKKKKKKEKKSKKNSKKRRKLSASSSPDSE
uniref:G-patch domain-containing protein n=1 Tax=Chaetoceros debilis TaxID=122233 RepID=A0A7S3V796_9STRA|mmetsp:Transcript_19746/g.29053  ORF Transcript_19746/g.29053 Transcript_19746/m.29053 type:complete len:283 (-) Transcript_19746:1023-1871(-)|eukprot:CAMPEP_0194087284 /NCGR_PEP_ID=MMETSP0149-20130528/24342_1 /TAXON_ID=122233 /ORGANISM="Chaetoceros debilis, Strain MM31A-1" /LENGTH=282 /DNA_ID=CAMNT_0038770591 /DNA_START=19 /DNA_END=867 /DNA_ORIENTATION=+